MKKCTVYLFSVWRFHDIGILRTKRAKICKNCWLSTF